MDWQQSRGDARVSPDLQLIPSCRVVGIFGTVAQMPDHFPMIDDSGHEYSQWQHPQYAHGQDRRDLGAGRVVVASELADELENV